MITLTIAACVAVFIAAIVLFTRELDSAMHDKVDVAANVVENEIKDLLTRAEVAAIGMANNPDLVNVLVNDDLEGIILMANALKSMAQIDFCNIIDSKGYVITRTHEPTRFGDNISNQPHVAKALEGIISSNITQGAVITIGAYAGSPVYDNDMERIGAISLGYRLDVQEFVYKMKELTGCEVTIFRNNMRVSSTIIDVDGIYAVGTQSEEHISDIVLDGGVYYGSMELFGEGFFAHYAPIFGFDGSVVGMIGIGYYTADDISKIYYFILTGALITIAILAVCIILAMYISGVIDRRQKLMMDRIREAQEELRLARDIAESASIAKSTFLANMSHEIRTPMNSIIGFTELAQDDEISTNTRDYLSNIQDSAHWLLNIINDILDISKIESGKIDLENIPFDLPDIFAHCHAAILQKAVEKGVMLYCYAEPSLGKKLLGDPVRLRQVITNLLSNAVKFTNTGTVKLLASINSSNEDHATIHFEIKDSGIGMTPEQIDRIFEPFKQADDSITRKFGGTGLGLAITKNIIDIMGGILCVESTPGVGSKFSFEITFDLIDDDTEKTTKKIVINDFEKPNFKGEVLVCEDNHLNQQVVCDHLARVGLDTVVASDGAQAVKIVKDKIKKKQKPFDLIFMDIHMPVMDGLEASALITEMGVKTPIVALTANVMSNDMEMYKQSGMSDTVGKPFTASELWRCLVKYIPVEKYTILDQSKHAAEELKMQKLLKVNFVKSNQDTFTKITEALEKEDIKAAHRIAHTLKSNAGQIGEKRLQSAAAVVESMLTEGANQLDDEQLKILETELNTVLTDLAPLHKEKRTKDGSVKVNKDKTLILIKKLEPLLVHRDTKCLELVDEIAETIPNSEELVGFIEDFEFTHALAVFEKLKDRLDES